MKNEHLKELAISYGFTYGGWRSGHSRLFLGNSNSVSFFSLYLAVSAGETKCGICMPLLDGDEGLIVIYVPSRDSSGVKRNEFESETNAIAFLRSLKAEGKLSLKFEGKSEVRLARSRPPMIPIFLEELSKL